MEIPFAGQRKSMRATKYYFLGCMLVGLQVTELFAAGGGDEVNLVGINKQMVLWTWVTFGLLLLILHKFAWKPILSALDQREKGIRESVENAEKIRIELEQIEGKRERLIKEADDKAKEIVATARKAAVEASRVIENKAKEEANILLENANREIKAAREKAEATLRHDSAELAIALAGKLIGENLDDTKNRTLTEQLINKI